MFPLQEQIVGEAMGKSGSSTKVFSEAWPPLVDRPSSVRFSSARRVKTSMWRASSAACIARTPLMAPRRPPASRLQLIFPETRHRDLLPERLALWFHYIFARGLLGKGGRSSSFVLASPPATCEAKANSRPQLTTVGSAIPGANPPSQDGFTGDGLSGSR